MAQTTSEVKHSGGANRHRLEGSESPRTECPITKVRVHPNVGKLQTQDILSYSTDR